MLPNIKRLIGCQPRLYNSLNYTKGWYSARIHRNNLFFNCTLIIPLAQLKDKIMKTLVTCAFFSFIFISPTLLAQSDPRTFLSAKQHSIYQHPFHHTQQTKPIRHWKHHHRPSRHSNHPNAILQSLPYKHAKHYSHQARRQQHKALKQNYYPHLQASKYYSSPYPTSRSKRHSYARHQPIRIYLRF